MNVYALVLAVIFPIIVIVVSGIVYKKREHPFVKSRKPDFIIVQNIGVLLSFPLCALYIGLKPDYPCSLNTLANVINNSVVGFVLLVRIWEYCISFHLTLLKAKFRFNEFVPYWSESSWLYRHSWIGKHSLMRKILAVGIFILTTPGVYYFTPRAKIKIDENSQTCILSASWTIPYGIVAFSLICSGLSVAVLIRNSKDAYRLRREMLILCCIWGFIFMLTYLWSFASSPEIQRIAPPVFFELVGQFCTIVISNLVPLYYAYKLDKKKQTKETLDMFIDLLECPNFRNTFYEFLSEQFCGENLQFYETVHQWKTLAAEDPRKRTNAQLIYESFVVDCGLCQVHIRSDTKDKIVEKLKGDNEVPNDIFDTAISELLQDMYYNSFLLFRATKQFLDSVTIELV